MKVWKDSKQAISSAVTYMAANLLLSGGGVNCEPGFLVAFTIFVTVCLIVSQSTSVAVAVVVAVKTFATLVTMESSGTTVEGWEVIIDAS